MKRGHKRKLALPIVPNTSYRNDVPNRRLLQGLGSVWVTYPTKKMVCSERKRCKGTKLTPRKKAVKFVFYHLETGHNMKWTCPPCGRAMLTRFIMDITKFTGQLTGALSMANAADYVEHLTDEPEIEVWQQKKEEEEEE